jgi:hypothetical protein
LASIAKASGKNQSELIREAIDGFIEQKSHIRRKEVLQKAAGIWKNRTDLPDFLAIRSEWGRNLSYNDQS